MTVSTPVSPAAYIFKIASRCNLNCSYCYMYNAGDTTFRTRPRVMDEQIAEQALRKIVEYAKRHGRRSVGIALHGGEPLLAGKAWTRRFLQLLDSVADDTLTFDVSVQTNGVLVDEEWLAIFSDASVSVGVSLDGPQDVHDLFRRDFSGRGSYDAVVSALELLRSAEESQDLRWGVLTVADPSISASELLDHLLSLRVKKFDVLWPDNTHDNPPQWAPGVLGRYFSDLFDAWYFRGDASLRFRWAESAIALSLGGFSSVDTIGPGPANNVVVETDGEWQPLDTLRIIGNGATATGLNVADSAIDDLVRTPLYQVSLREPSELAASCQSCELLEMCGGGYIAHRFSGDRGFRNPSVHCYDLAMVLRHIRTVIRADLRGSDRAREQACL